MVPHADKGKWPFPLRPMPRGDGDPGTRINTVYTHIQVPGEKCEGLGIILSYNSISQTLSESLLPGALPFMEQTHCSLRLRIQGERQELHGDWPRGRILHHKVLHLDMGKGKSKPREGQGIAPEISLQKIHNLNLFTRHHHVNQIEGHFRK